MIKKCIIVLMLTAFVWFLLANLERKSSVVTKLIPDTSKVISETDEPALAQQYEYERTKDLNLGYVPHERLYEAYLYITNNKSLPMSAIPGIVWTERGPNNCGGRTRTIMIDPNDATKKTIWAGGVDGGLWKTTDITVANPVWIQINDFFSNLAVTTIAYNPANKQIMYFGTGEGWYNIDAVRGDGIWKSTDGGTNWAQLPSTASNSNFDYVSKIVVDATGNVYCANRSHFCNRGGVFKSTDGGTNWALVLGTQGGTCATSYCQGDDIEIAADGDLYVGMGDFAINSDGLYRSTTGNAGTWTKVGTWSNSGRIEVACAPSSEAIIYAMVENRTNQTLLNIYKSTNNGNNWSTCSNPTWYDQACSNSADITRGQAWYDLAIAVDPNNANNVFIGGVDLLKSTNGGTNWKQISNWANLCGLQLVHADQHIILFETGSSDIIYFGNDGGVWKTTNGTANPPTITQKNSSYNVTQFYSCAIHPTLTNYFLAGAQDNSSHQFKNAGMNSTIQVTGGDGGFCHIDQNNGIYQYTSYTYCQYARSTNNGVTWDPGWSWGGHGQFINPTDYDNTQFILYASYDAGYYFRWTDPRTGTTASIVNVAAFGGQVTAVTVSPNTANRVFFGIDNGRVVRVDNANGAAPTGTSISTGLPAGTVSCIEVETGNDNHLIVTYSNYGIVSVWESTNGGTSWTSVEGNLPDIPIRWVLFNPYSNKQVFLATELGVWSTDLLNGASTVWGTSNTGLANVRVDMLQLRNSDKLIAASTHGRGLYTTTIPVPLPIELLNFTAKIDKSNIILNWSTATETNNDYFTIEKSKDIKNWVEVSQIDGAGNSNTILNYSYMDENPYPNVSYYRLKQTDYNGKFSYSKIISIDFNEISLFNIVNIKITDNEVTVYFNSVGTPFYCSIVDISGNLILERRGISFNGLNDLTFNTTDLKSGIYLLTLYNGEKTITKKIFLY